jgi:hypothetical protein
MQSSDLEHRLSALEAEVRRARGRTKLVLVIAVIAVAWACNKTTTSAPPDYLEVRNASGAIARLDADGLVFHHGLGEASYGPLQLSIASKDAAKAELGPTHFELGQLASEGRFDVMTSGRQASLTLGNSGTTSAELRVDGAATTPAGKETGSLALALSGHLARFAVTQLDNVDVSFFGQGGYALHGTTETGEWECKHDGQPCKK